MSAPTAATHHRLRRCPLCGSESHALLFERDGCRHVRCRDCQFVFVNPQPVDDAAVNARLYGSDHSDVTQFLERVRALPAERVPAFMARLAEHPPARRQKELRLLERFRGQGRLLDVGCSAGQFLLAARHRDWTVQGVEVAAETASLGREVFGLDIHHGGLETFPTTAPFDVLRANQVIEHLQDPARFLRQAADLLRPGGLLVLATVNYRSLSRMWIGPHWRHLGNAHNGHVSFFTPRTLRQALERAGLRVVTCTTTGFRSRNPGQPRSAVRRLCEKAVSPLAGALGLGGRFQVYAVRN